MNFDLIAEFTDAERGTSTKTDVFLRNLGISQATLYGGASLVGRSKVIFEDNGTYQPHPDGVDALIVPTGQRGEHNIIWEGIDDLIAFRPHAPHRWHRRLATAVLLNDEAARKAELFGNTLPVWSTPLSWLTHGAQGVVVLDWTAHLPFYLDGIKELAAEDDALGHRLQTALRSRTNRGPRVVVIDAPGASYAA